MKRWKLRGVRPASHYPPALLKAAEDRPWFYTAKLRSGEMIGFSGATLHGGDWVTLHRDDERNDDIPVLATRGVDVRLPEITWVVDEGS